MRERERMRGREEQERDYTGKDRECGKHDVTSTSLCQHCSVS